MRFDTIKVEGSGAGPHLLVVAGVHGDEWEGMVAARRLAAALSTSAGALRGRVTIIPILNNPAYHLGSRTGDDGLDLARTCPGHDGGSDTEQIAFEFTRLLDDVDFLIDLHTGGLQLSIWPLAGYLLHKSAPVLDQQRCMARAFGLPAVWGTDPTVNGRTISVARDKLIPAIYVEYLGSGDFRQAAVEAMVRGCRQVMAAVNMLPFDGPSTQPQYVCEDDRLGSGHLQASHPAPMGGLFEPLVEPGDWIEAGFPLGCLTSDDSHSARSIPAISSGRVVAIRKLPKVRTGDALGVVAEFQEL